MSKQKAVQTIQSSLFQCLAGQYPKRSRLAETSGSKLEDSGSESGGHHSDLIVRQVCQPLRAEE